MRAETEGIVLRQTKISHNRKMVQLFTRQFGRISAGTSIGEGGKSKSSLAIHPFTYGRYTLFRGRDSYNIDSAEVIRSYYRIGEDVEKYMQAAYVLEFTGKALPEGMPAPRLLDELTEFLRILENRKRGLGTLVLAYQVKLLALGGFLPELNRCVCCGRDRPAFAFSVPEGGILCRECAEKGEKTHGGGLIYCGEFGIVEAIEFFVHHPLKKLENIALSEEMGKLLQHLVREYAAYHLDIRDMKSEKLV